jgi:hypothetical protein
MTDDVTPTNNTWVCRHGKRHPLPAAGYALCCSCPADASWIGNDATEVSAKPNKRHQELSDDEIDDAPIDDLRAAYRTLREHHIAETTALDSRREDLARRCDELSRKCEEMLAKSSRTLTASQQLVERTASILRDDEGIVAKVLAPRAVAPTDLAMTDHLSDKELTAWAEQAGVYSEKLRDTYLRLALDELRERRDAEVFFVEADRALQAVECEACTAMSASDPRRVTRADIKEIRSLLVHRPVEPNASTLASFWLLGAGYIERLLTEIETLMSPTPRCCEEHQDLLKRWRITREALCELARIHRGYLRSLDAPDEGDPR